ncbi:zinc transporter 9 [Strongylocentrotus purpuratus]|uniref:Proton-coupled zinc antiporter SLC30A9, mitochondrial n=1 Tax=Strongylocentrotus purpuratus TaxID=7668 RepID=A0A7M7HJY5_STRPU|nr:zinc transporter 9 [Strongylocentrotus purpuratus]
MMLRSVQARSPFVLFCSKVNTDSSIHHITSVCRHHLSKNTFSKLHPTRRDISSLTRRPSQLFQRVQSSKISNVRTLSSKKDGDKEEVSAATSGNEKPFVVTTKKSKKDIAEPVVKASVSASGEPDPPSESKEGKSPAAERLANLTKAIASYKERRRKVDYTKKYTDNNTITAVRAMSDYLLKSSDLEQLRKTVRRSPYDQESSERNMMVYLRSDVEQKAIEIWGSMDALEMEKKKRRERDAVYKEHLFLLKRAMREYDSFFGPKEPTPSIFEGAGQVVLSAIAINTGNFVFKLMAWLYSGSSSMFSEAIHSLADVCNQCILALGIYQSFKKPSRNHPYGFSNMRHISSLISGVGIFCVGAGLSFYHGITGLLHPEPVQSLFWSYCILGGALLTEGATLSIAINAIRKGSTARKMKFWDYVWRARDPSVNVVFMEDTAAVIGVIIAGSCMGLTSITGNPMYDSIGALGVGTLLGAVSGFLIYTNTMALTGRSIPDDQLLKLSEVMENDVMIRGVYDVKATDMGVNTIRFKAELDIDGAELTRSYLDTQDLEVILKEIQSFKNLEEVEYFMLKHGERIIDQLGAEVDRIEKLIKATDPEVRHVDLEIL